MTSRILLRHLRGSKAHRVDQFPLADVEELTLGRATASDVRFDNPLEDTISRRHAVIRVSRGEPVSFRILDLGSGNGVRVNGRPVQVEQDLRADDLVELGPDGPAFTLDVEPASVAAAGARDATIRMPVPPPPGSREEDPVRASVRARIAAGRPVRGALVLATAVALAAGAGTVLERNAADAGHDVTAGQALPGREPAGPPVPAPPVADAQAVPPRPAGPAAPSAAVVAIEARWRLYDKATGQPVFQKVLARHGQRLACLVETEDGRIVPWLTTADEDHLNTPVGGVLRGSGFIVDSDGSIITDRHIAAGWTANYPAAGPPGRKVALFRAGDTPADGHAPRIVDPAGLGNGAGPDAWVPDDGGPLFGARRPVAIGGGGRNLEGRNERLDVLLPRDHARTPARLVLLSPDADAAELRIDVGHPLPALPLARDPVPAAGTPVTILGYVGAPPGPLDGRHRAGEPDGEAAHLVSLDGTIGPAPDPAGGRRPGDAPSGAAEGLFLVSTGVAGVPNGGPVLGADGAVLGVVASGLAGQERTLSAFAAKAARTLLESR